jgi:hypothetical protein
MTLLRTVLWSAARRLARDPRVQAAARDAYAAARPRVEAAVRQTAAIARETPPLADPAGFARRLRELVLKRPRG